MSARPTRPLAGPTSGRAAHERAAEFLGCDPGEVAFGQSMTALNFLLTRALARELTAGDETLVTRLDHDGNVSPWLALAEDLGVAVSTWTSTTTSPSTSTTWAANRSPRTKVVAFPAAANSVGTAPDVHLVVDLAHEAGALAWVDAVHYGPHGRIDVRRGAATSSSARRTSTAARTWGWPSAGRSCSGAGGRTRWAAADEPVGHRFELGTCQHELLAGFVAAVDYVHELGWEAIAAYEGALGQRFLDGFPPTPTSTASRQWKGACRRSASASRSGPRSVADTSPTRGRGLVGQLLRPRDHPAARARRGRRRRTGGHRPLQHRRGGRPAARRRRGAGAGVKLLLLGGPKFVGPRGDRHGARAWPRGDALQPRHDRRGALPGAGADRRRPRLVASRASAGASGTTSLTRRGSQPPARRRPERRPARRCRRALRLRLEHLRLRVAGGAGGRGVAARGSVVSGVGGHRDGLRRAQGPVRAGGRRRLPGPIDARGGGADRRSSRPDGPLHVLAASRRAGRRPARPRACVAPGPVRRRPGSRRVDGARRRGAADRPFHQDGADDDGRGDRPLPAACPERRRGRSRWTTRSSRRKA